MKEVTAFWNKEYRDRPDGSFLAALQTAFVKRLNEFYGGRKADHIYYADDCFVVYRNLGFLQNARFERALAEAKVDQTLLGRLWRLWVVAWSLKLRWHTTGSVVDCGTYNGKAFEVGVRYCQSFGLQRRDSLGKVLACDFFQDPPEEARKAEHGPDLYNAVRNRLSAVCGAIVVRGELPGSIDNLDIGQVTWAQIDLNSASADLSVFKFIFPLLSPGAVVLFDDYGFSRYRETQQSIDQFLVGTQGAVLELPTGQGLYIHAPSPDCTLADFSERLGA